MSNLNEVIILTLKENGVLIQDNDYTDENIEKFYLTQLDSLQFISFLCDLEEKLGIEIPENLLVNSDFENFISNLKLCIKN